MSIPHPLFNLIIIIRYCQEAALRRRRLRSAGLTITSGKTNIAEFRQALVVFFLPVCCCVHDQVTKM